MTTNPFYNALLAIAYIVGLVSIAFLGPRLLGGPEESIIYPMLGLSVFVLSAAIMAYLFFYQPILMLIDGQREKAIKLFLHTVAIFGVAIMLMILASVIVSP